MSDKIPGQTESEAENNQVVDVSVESNLNPSRRKFAKAGIIAPIVLTVGARPAFANMCSISGGGSPGSNQQQPDACLGCTPGYWKRNVHAWPNIMSAGITGVDGLEPAEGTCSPTSTGNVNSTCKVYLNDGTRFDDIFTNAQNLLLSGVTFGTLELNGVTPGQGDLVDGSVVEGDYFVQVNDASATPAVPTLGYYDISIMQVLWLDKSSAPVTVALAFHLAAAFLNAMSFPDEYGYNPADIIKIYDDAMAGVFPVGISDLEGLKNQLDTMNNRGCPLSGNANA
ncbi:MAG: hypothetical protein JKX83_05580 [Pseudomonadales bacterium]|nr:hypothetical protein [Pseudomonadales bacterium]